MQWWKLCRKWNAALGFKVAQLSRSSCWCMLILFQSIWKLEVFWRYPSFKFLARDQFHSLCRRFDSIYGSSATTALLICKSSIKPVRLWNSTLLGGEPFYTSFHMYLYPFIYMVLLDHYFNVVVSFRFSCEKNILPVYIDYFLHFTGQIAGRQFHEHGTKCTSMFRYREFKTNSRLFQTIPRFGSFGKSQHVLAVCSCAKSTWTGLMCLSHCLTSVLRLSQTSFDLVRRRHENQWEPPSKKARNTASLRVDTLFADQFQQFPLWHRPFGTAGQRRESRT